MRNRDLPAPRVWLAACLAAGLGASAAVQATPAKPVKWVVTCPAPKPREAARPEVDAVAQAADDAAAASPDAPAPVPPAPTAALPLPAPASAAPVQAAPPDAVPVPQPLPSLVPREAQEPEPTPAVSVEGAAKPPAEPEGLVDAPAAQRLAPEAASTQRASDARPAHAAALQPVSLPAGPPVVPAASAHLAVAAAAAPATAPPAVPPAAPSVAPPLPPLAGEPQRWDVRIADVTLAKTLARWAQEAGYRLQWDAARNYLISAPSTFTGAFEDAVAQALGTPGVRSGDYPLEACLYANTPPLIRVTRQGEQVRECEAVSP